MMESQPRKAKSRALRTVKMPKYLHPYVLEDRKRKSPEERRKQAAEERHQAMEEKRIRMEHLRQIRELKLKRKEEKSKLEKYFAISSFTTIQAVEQRLRTLEKRRKQMEIKARAQLKKRTVIPLTPEQVLNIRKDDIVQTITYRKSAIERDAYEEVKAEIGRMTKSEFPRNRQKELKIQGENMQVSEAKRFSSVKPNTLMNVQQSNMGPPAKPLTTRNIQKASIKPKTGRNVQQSNMGDHSKPKTEILMPPLLNRCLNDQTHEEMTVKVDGIKEEPPVLTNNMAPRNSGDFDLVEEIKFHPPQNRCLNDQTHEEMAVKVDGIKEEPPLLTKNMAPRYSGDFDLVVEEIKFHPPLNRCLNDQTHEEMAVKVDGIKEEPPVLTNNLAPWNSGEFDLVVEEMPNRSQITPNLASRMIQPKNEYLEEQGDIVNVNVKIQPIDKTGDSCLFNGIVSSSCTKDDFNSSYAMFKDSKTNTNTEIAMPSAMITRLECQNNSKLAVKGEIPKLLENMMVGPYGDIIKEKKLLVLPNDDIDIKAPPSKKQCLENMFQPTVVTVKQEATNKVNNSNEYEKKFLVNCDSIVKEEELKIFSHHETSPSSASDLALQKNMYLEEPKLSIVEVKNESIAKVLYSDLDHWTRGEEILKYSLVGENNETLVNNAMLDRSTDLKSDQFNCGKENSGTHSYLTPSTAIVKLENTESKSSNSHMDLDPIDFQINKGNIIDDTSNTNSKPSLQIMSVHKEEFSKHETVFRNMQNDKVPRTYNECKKEKDIPGLSVGDFDNLQLQNQTVRLAEQVKTEFKQSTILPRVTFSQIYDLIRKLEPIKTSNCDSYVKRESNECLNVPVIGVCNGKCKSNKTFDRPQTIQGKEDSLKQRDKKFDLDLVKHETVEGYEQRMIDASCEGAYVVNNQVRMDSNQCEMEVNKDLVNLQPVCKNEMGYESQDIHVNKIGQSTVNYKEDIRDTISEDIGFVKHEGQTKGKAKSMTECNTVVTTACVSCSYNSNALSPRNVTVKEERPYKDESTIVQNNVGKITYNSDHVKQEVIRENEERFINCDKIGETQEFKKEIFEMEKDVNNNVEASFNINEAVIAGLDIIQQDPVWEFFDEYGICTTVHKECDF